MHNLLFSLLAATAVVADWTTQNWDAIVVGAGPAGIIVAHRLAEAKLSTLLIEGGGPSYGVTGGDIASRRPGWLNGTDLTRVDVLGLYKSIFGNGGGLTCEALSREYAGCTIGGSGAINAGLFIEPPASDWDLYFPEGWKSANISAAIARLYDMQPSTNLTSLDGKRYLQSGYDAAKKWIVEGLGFKELDINGNADDKTEVFGHPIYASANGQRGGPVVSYLQSTMKLPNFHLQSGTRVIRVERKDTASGVIVSIDGKETLVKLSSKGRVILSAGAIQSPNILMYSGIGDPESLTNLTQSGNLTMPESEWIKNSAVGAGLFDNPNTFVELEASTIDSYVYSYSDPEPTDKELFLNHRSGPYTFASQTSVFWDTFKREDGSVAAFQGTIDSSGYRDYTDDNTITLNVYGTSGLKSRGRVTIDNKGIPGSDGNVYYSTPSDAVEIATFIHKIFAGLSATANTTLLTPLNIPQNASIAEITTYISTPSPYAVGPLNHFTSSCKIGECVDEYTRVKGVDNLHVVDASILEPPTVNPQFAVMAAAERASELLLELFDVPSNIYRGVNVDMNLDTVL